MHTQIHTDTFIPHTYTVSHRTYTYTQIHTDMFIQHAYNHSLTPICTLAHSYTYTHSLTPICTHSHTDT